MPAPPVWAGASGAFRATRWKGWLLSRGSSKERNSEPQTQGQAQTVRRLGTRPKAGGRRGNVAFGCGGSGAVVARLPPAAAAGADGMRGTPFRPNTCRGACGFAAAARRRAFLRFAAVACVHDARGALGAGDHGQPEAGASEARVPPLA